jgi:hypothetical protein
MAVGMTMKMVTSVMWPKYDAKERKGIRISTVEARGLQQYVINL